MKKAFYASHVVQEKGAKVAKKTLTLCEDWLVQPYKTERDHLNIKKLRALFVAIHYLVYGCVKCDTNILKMHMCANIKKVNCKPNLKIIITKQLNIATKNFAHLWIFPGLNSQI